MRLLVIGFPKSGTTSITAALMASGLSAAHWADGAGSFVGRLIYEDALAGRDPFTRLSQFDAVTQADVCIPAHGINYWPQLDFAMLARIRAFHPDCWFLLNYRDAKKVCDSIDRWPAMRERITKAAIPGLPAGWGGEDRHLIQWIESHYAACRAYLGNDPRFAEVDIESSDAPLKIGDMLGIEIIGWDKVQPELPGENDIRILRGAKPPGSGGVNL